MELVGELDPQTGIFYPVTANGEGETLQRWRGVHHWRLAVGCLGLLLIERDNIVRTGEATFKHKCLFVLAPLF